MSISSYDCNYSKNNNFNGCVQQGELCNCCKIRESDWCMLLDLIKIKSIHQSGS